ncbi:hypothetical protein R0131_01940 [Clostridium sp. AL.422]|uniref:hypothetical protein n=1 Tax=Clostridium TaxID=1485 RepID=UPI00293DF9B0|nr:MULTISPECIES: hypothetical protein [unclassified Clostridium]MDV4149585.1 hypothetical protein [Clostridium sp. AL.422]
MNYDRADMKNLQDLYDECNKLMSYHITIVMKDGSTVDGMIEKVDSNGIIMLVGEDIMDDDDGDTSTGERQFGKGPGMRRHRRFRRRGYPFNSIRRVLPIVYPYPFFPFFPY